MNGGRPHAAPQPPEHPPILPRPMETRVEVGQGVGKNGVVAVLRFTTPQGVNVFFLEPHMCIDVAEALSSYGKAAKSGLIVAESIDEPGT